MGKIHQTEGDLIKTYLKDAGDMVNGLLGRIDRLELQNQALKDQGLHRFEDQEVATILAALRYWQRAMTDAASGKWGSEDPTQDSDLKGYFDVDEPLDVDAIDDLAERINCNELEA